MKKLLICLTVLFSAFLFTNSISAEDLGVEITVNSSVYETDHFVSYTDIFYEYTIYETLKNYDIDVSDYKYIIINNYGGQRNIMIYLFNDLFTFIDVDNRTGGISKSLRAAPSGINYTVLKYNYDNTVEKIGKYTSNGINSSSLANWYFNDGYFMLSLATSSRISYSNYDTGITGTYSSVQNVLTLPTGNSTFNETINSLNYSKVEFVFDIPDMEKTFNFNYDFHSSDNSTTFKSPYFEETYTSCSTDESGVSSCRPFPLTNNFLIEEGTEENGQCHLNEFGLPNCYKPNDYSNDDEINVSNSYVVSNYDMVLNNDILTKVTSSLKLVLDLEFNSNVIVDVSFTSSLPFDVVYHERTTVSNHYETVDLTGKYGAVFMPKFDITDEVLNIRTLFKGTGNLDVQHRSSLDIVNYKILSAYSLNYCNDFLFNQNLIPYSCNEFNGEFEFYVSNSNLEQALFFVNGHYSDDELTEVNVMYDTRYYDYWVFDTPTSIVPITNPNTGDNSYISLEEFYNFAEVDTGFLTDLVNKMLDFFFEKFPVVKQFKMIISLFTYNEDFDDAPVFTVSLDSIGINKEVQIIDFSIFDQYRSTVIFWEMLFITTITIVKVTENVGKAFKGN